MRVLIVTACCGVGVANGIWAYADGDVVELDAELGGELVRCGHAVLSDAVGANAPTASAFLAALGTKVGATAEKAKSKKV